MNVKGMHYLADAMIDLFYQTFLGNSEEAYKEDRSIFLRGTNKLWFIMAERVELYDRWRNLYIKYPTLESLHKAFPIIEEVVDMRNIRKRHDIGHLIRSINKSYIKDIEGEDNIVKEINKLYPKLPKIGYYLITNNGKYVKITISPDEAKKHKKIYKISYNRELETIIGDKNVYY